MWAAYGVSEFGSAVGSGALPLVALTVLGVNDWQVSLLAAVGGFTSAVLALPLGPAVEGRAKRPTMVMADVVRAFALVSVPIAAWLGGLSFVQLCVVNVITTTGAIVFGAASTAHLAWLVPSGRRVRLASRFESTSWMSSAVGPPLGGAVISVFGATATLAIDAVSFLASAAAVRSLRTPEPETPGTDGGASEGRFEVSGFGITAGWRVIWAHRGLRALYVNALLFGGSLMMAYPLQIVLMLRHLGFAPWQYGLALGLPAVGGFFGAMAMPRLAARVGERRVMLGSGVLRTLWLIFVAVAPPGAWGVVVITLADGALLFGAGVFNPLFATYRMSETPDGYLARVTTAWSVGSRVVQPSAMVVGAVLVSVMPVRGVIAVAAALLLASGVFLPWRGTASPHPSMLSSKI